jgi:hypothetical protein
MSVRVKISLNVASREPPAVRNFEIKITQRLASADEASATFFLIVAIRRIAVIANLIWHALDVATRDARDAEQGFVTRGNGCERMMRIDERLQREMAKKRVCRIRRHCLAYSASLCSVSILPTKFFTRNALYIASKLGCIRLNPRSKRVTRSAFPSK